MTRAGALAGLLHRIAYAILCGVATWYFVVVPFTYGPLSPSVLFWGSAVINAPVSFVNRILPPQAKGIDTWGRERQPEHENMWELLHIHLRVAVPTYVLLFYLPIVARLSCRILAHGSRRRNGSAREVR